jgi:hypothetical protein
MYVQQCMLGPNAYGVPIARRNDGVVIETQRNLSNWIKYPLPKPKPRSGTTFKVTCFKPLGLFLISPSLQCIQAFNHGADPWDVLGHREKPSAVSITFNDTDEFLHIGSSIEEQHRMRSEYVRQCARLGLPAPVFKGFVCFVPVFNNMYNARR